MKNVIMLVIVALMFGVGTGVSVSEGALIISDPNQLIGVGGNEYISMDFGGDNLMERVDGVDSVFDKGNGEAYVLFGEKIGDVVEWAGWFGTNNISSDNDPGYEAWCEGEINRSVLPAGGIPNFYLGFYDDDDGQFALLYSGKFLVFDANVQFFPKLEYAGLIDGLTSVAIGETVEHTVIIPEPVTMALVSLGSLALLRRKKPLTPGPPTRGHAESNFLSVRASSAVSQPDTPPEAN